MEASVSSHRQGATLTLTVAGEIDRSAGPAVRSALNEAVATEGVTAVEVDLSGVSFLDSSGIAMLLHGRRSADEHSVAYRVTGARGIAREVLELTGVWAHLSGEPDPNGRQ